MKKVLSLPPPSHIATMFRAETWDALRAEFAVHENPSPTQMPQDEIMARLGDCDAVLTGWGSPPFSWEMLEAAPDVKLFAHTAGSVKFLFAPEVVREVLIPRGITVFSGNDGLALNVAEATIGLMITASRRWPQQAESFRRLKRRDPGIPDNGQFLIGATVGLVSASKVAHHVVRLLQPFDCEILIYDPFVTPATARGLGVELVELNDLLARSDIVSVHTPALPDTEKMIGAAQLEELRDGAIFINTARGHVVDHDALLEECRNGRIVAALDVTTPEPLPGDSEFWKLPNVLLLPHLAGSGHAGYFSIGDAALDALRDCFANRPVAGTVPLNRWDVLA